MSNIPLIRPYIDYESVRSDFEAVFNSGIFTRGMHVQAFQQEIAQFTGAKHAFLTTSATTALWMCLRLLNIGPGDEVIVSDFSFPASSNVIEDVGATPVFADVLLDTYNMDPDNLERLITDKTRAVIFVDALGNPTGLTRIQEICTKNGIPLIEDAACAIGSSEHGVKCGNVADITCFSFHPRKLLCTGEGGAITTNNDVWAETLKRKLAHGAAPEIKGVALDFPEFGYNFRLSELQAVMGRKQLATLDVIIEERKATQSAYVAGLEPLGFRPQSVSNAANHNIQSLTFTVPAGTSRDSIILSLKAVGVEASIGTYALSAIEYNAKKYNSIQPKAKALYDTTLSLPCYSGVDHERVIREIKGVMQKAA